MSTACEPCGATATEPTGHRNVLGLGADLIRCIACGVKRYDRRVLDPREANDSPAAHTLADDTARCGAMNNRDPAEVERFRAAHASTYNAMVDALRLHAGRLDRLYEVGCLVGEFLGVARAAGVPHVAGCDANARGCEIARAAGLDVEHAFFGDANLVPIGLDAVVMLDVLEHTPTPRADLQRAHWSLRSGGVLLVKTFYDEWHASLPGGPSWAGGWDDPRRGYFDPIGHLHHFDEPVLRALIERVGFRVAEWSRNAQWGQVTCYGVKP